MQPSKPSAPCSANDPCLSSRSQLLNTARLSSRHGIPISLAPRVLVSNFSSTSRKPFKVLPFLRWMSNSMDKMDVAKTSESLGKLEREKNKKMVIAEQLSRSLYEENRRRGLSHDRAQSAVHSELTKRIVVSTLAIFLMAWLAWKIVSGAWRKLNGELPRPRRRKDDGFL
ncbi:hypothetical protein VTL71DRAFT_14139 [Oculimacula yallundae]|uniref:Uncharacterized protein n=1 Tax=Oculimacula yallundae TaxID=86028 RepID=A0ABR4CIA9_9HELO